MWVRASYTVENAVIVPLFSMIIILLVSFTCNIHDEIIRENVTSQIGIEVELNEMDTERKKDMERFAEEYLKERCIFTHNYKVNADESPIKKSQPEKNIRIMRALIEAVN